MEAGEQGLGRAGAGGGGGGGGGGRGDQTLAEFGRALGSWSGGPHQAKTQNFP